MATGAHPHLLHSVAVRDDTRKRCLRLVCGGPPIHHLALGEEVLLRDLFNDRLVKRLRALGDQMLCADRLAHHTVNQVSVFGPLALLHQVGRALCVA